VGGRAAIKRREEGGKNSICFYEKREGIRRKKNPGKIDYKNGGREGS